MIVKSVGDAVAGRPVPAVQSGASVLEAIAVLTEFDIGAVLVLEGERLVGLMSERDVVRRCVQPGLPAATTPVSEIMTPEPDSVQSTDSLAEALRHLIRGGFRHLAVLDGTRCAGLLSVRDIPTEYRMMLERFEEMRGS